MSTQEEAIAAFVRKWEHASGSEISNSQPFIGQLCRALGLEEPHTTPEENYMFERPVPEKNPDGTVTNRRIDCYKRGHFVLESKKLNPGVNALATGKTTRGFDEAMIRALRQAEGYVRALPADEGRPPFIVLIDVGHVFEIYAEFTRSGGNYTAFPNHGPHRFRLEDLKDPKRQELLRALWTDPLSLDPSRISAKVTRKVSAELAELAKSLKADGHDPEDAASFLTRCLFSMFAEDIGLLPNSSDSEGSFLHLLKEHKEDPVTLREMMRALWQSMDTGGFSAAIRKPVMHFNGKLFKNPTRDKYVLPLKKHQIEGLLRAASANWKEVEPAIFGTLLEQALTTNERHSFGAHFTPRAYVERLVLPTVIEPLRGDWANAQAAALMLAREAQELEANPPLRTGGDSFDTFDRVKEVADRKARDEHQKQVRAKWQEARQEIERFHHYLCSVRVLDPACGSGNFLYVTLEHLKRLEGEVLDRLKDFGGSTASIVEGETVTLKQLIGIELNERAAAVAELVLWIGWLQWHVRTRGIGSVAEPVVHDYRNIENRDAVLAYDERVPEVDASGNVVTRWDGRTTKKHHVTGEDVPDESAQVPQWAYVNPRQAEWPQAEFVVGNPPFIGNKRMREALGDGYAKALRRTWPELSDTADFVMYWWHHAAVALNRGDVRRFGLITTNSITQIFNRRIVEGAGVDLAFAIPDHPWVDGAEGAAVRVAMTVGAREPKGRGALVRVVSEGASEDGAPVIDFKTVFGLINPNLTVGANVNSASPLRANAGLSFMGMIPLGAGFWINDETAEALGRGSVSGLDKHIRSYRNGKDLTDRPRGVFAIDFFGLTEDQVRLLFPAAYQWLLERVKPQRQQDKRASYRDNWWIFCEPRRLLRAAIFGLPRYIGTTETAKHRVFSFLDASVLPDQKIRVIASSDALLLGVLSSIVHCTWAPRAGGKLGVGNDPVYNNTRCFAPFPFPDGDTGLTPALGESIRSLAEHLDAHRKARQGAHDSATFTGMYNVLEKLRREEPLNTKEQLINEHGLVGVLRTLHDDLDAVVLQAYGWSDLGPVPWKDETARQAWSEAVLTRLVDLNAKRAAEEAQGTIRWLRPEFQDPARRGTQPAQQQVDMAMGDDAEAADATPAAPVTVARLPWPSELPEQVKAVADVLTATSGALTEASLAERFTGRGPWKKRLPQILHTLEAVGRARQQGSAWRGT